MARKLAGEDLGAFGNGYNEAQLVPDDLGSGLWFCDLGTRPCTCDLSIGLHIQGKNPIYTLLVSEIKYKLLFSLSFLGFAIVHLELIQNFI